MGEDKPEFKEQTDIRRQAEDVLKGNTTELEKLVRRSQEPRS